MTPKQKIEHGNRFPFDAPDAWWDACNEEATPPTDWAHAAARGIIADLQDRRGIKQGFQRGEYDDAIRAEIVNTMAAIIREAAASIFTSQPPTKTP